MKHSLVTLGAVTALVGALTVSSAARPAPASSGHATAVPAFRPTPPLAPPRQVVHFGYVRSLVSKGARYELRFDPAFFLTGVTANRAAREDGVIGPGETVPNDYYIRNESRRTLTYLVPRTARITVITNPGTGIRATRVPVSELARIVKGENPKKRPLYGRRLGFWARVSSDTVHSLDQQYQP